MYVTVAAAPFSSQGGCLNSRHATLLMQSCPFARRYGKFKRSVRGNELLSDFIEFEYVDSNVRFKNLHNGKASFGALLRPCADRKLVRHPTYPFLRYKPLVDMA